MKKLQIVLTQKRKAKQGESINSISPSFEAVRTVEVENVVDTAEVIADFCKGIINLVERNTKLGYRSAQNGVKKSLPMAITIKSVKGNDVELSLMYNSFGKFAHQATKTNLKKFLEINMKFAQQYSWQQSSKLRKVS